MKLRRVHWLWRKAPRAMCGMAAGQILGKTTEDPLVWRASNRCRRCQREGERLAAKLAHFSKMRRD